MVLSVIVKRSQSIVINFSSRTCYDDDTSYLYLELCLKRVVITSCQVLNVGCPVSMLLEMK